MAKDKTKPRADLAPRREIEAKLEAEKKAKRRRRLAINWIIAIVIVALVVVGIWAAWSHVKAGEREVSITGPANVTQIPPTNPSNDGMSIIVQQDQAAAYSPDLPIPTPTPSATDSATPADTPTDTATPAPTPTETPSASSTASAPYVVDLYVDFQSSDSAAVQTTYGPALTALAASGQITLRYHLLTGDDTTYSNTASSRAAIAAVCADTVGKFLPYTQALMEATPLTVITSGALVFDDKALKVDLPAKAGITGADLQTFQTCYTNRATSSFVSTMNAANQATAVPGNQDYAQGVTTTPAMVAASPDTPTIFQTVDIETDMNGGSASTSEDALLNLIVTSAEGLAASGG